MPLAAGTRIGPYEVLSVLGAGGMGEVYRARDVRLNREVAIKTLLETYAQDPELLARFQREAQTLAALNHPNIAQIYAIEEIPGGIALVMEMIDGPTLADRVSRGALPLAEAMPIALQLAEALEYAHGKNVIHRDLKPANVKLRSDGTVKVLDFGLAKRTLERPPGGGTARMTAAMLTQPGTVFGTPGYMAPELLRGEPADVRSDIFALGVVLFELLTGHHPFLRPSVFEMAEAILSPSLPQWPATPTPVPEVVQFVVRKAMAKDVRTRYQSIYELRTDLVLSGGSQAVPVSSPTMPSGLHDSVTVPLPSSTDRSAVMSAAERLPSAMPAALASSGPPVAQPPSVVVAPGSVVISPRALKKWLPIAGALVLVLLAAGGYAIWRATQSRGGRAAAPVEHTQITRSGNVRGVAFSPDGRTVAYVAESPQGSSVKVRDVAGGGELEVWKGDIVVELQWMPDGSQIVVSGFEKGESIAGAYLVPRLTGAARRLPGKGGAHIAISADGKQIAMAFLNETQFRASDAKPGQPNPSGLRIISVDSGTERFVPIANERFRWLLGLDWGRTSNRIAVLTTKDEKSSTVWLVAPDGSESRPIYSDPDTLASIRWSPFGDVLYMIRARGESGEVLRLDDVGTQAKATTLLTGLPWDAADPYLRQSSLSTDGKRLLYVRSFAYANLWRLPTAGGTPQPLTQGTSRYGRADVSPDGQWIVTSLGTISASAIVRIPIDGGEPVSLTSGESQDISPMWSPDGKQIAFISTRGPTQRPGVWLLDPELRSTREVPNAAAEAQVTTSLDWLPDGSLMWLMPGGRDYFIRHLVVGTQQRLLADARSGMPGDARVSPQGDRIAIWFNRASGRGEDGLWSVNWPSRDEAPLLKGNFYPAGWSPDGSTVYAYESLRSAIVKVGIAGTAAEPVGNIPFGALENCSVTPDGKTLICTVREMKSDAWLVDNFDPDAPEPRP